MISVKIDKASQESYSKQFLAQLMAEIARGELKPGEKLPSAKQLASDLNLSYKVVEATLSDLAALGFIERSRKKGSFVKGMVAEQDKAACENGNVLFMLESREKENYPLDLNILRHARRICAEAGMSLIVKGVDEYTSKGGKWWEEIRREPGLRGVIFDKEGMKTVEALKFLESTPLPSVFFNSNAYPAVPAQTSAFIAQDFRMSAYQAVESLVAGGHRKIAFIQRSSLDPNIGYSSDTGKRDGYLLSLQKNEIPVRDEHVMGEVFNHAEMVKEATLALLRLEERPTAIFCADDIIAFLAIRSLVESGVDIPGDISVMGYNDFEIATACRPYISTVRVPTDKYAALLTRKLISMINGKHDTNNQELIATELILRDSTRAING